MRILIIHNRYLQRGGEDQVFCNEVNMLRKRGHKVTTYIEDNFRISSLPRAQAALRTTWSTETYENIQTLIHKNKINIVHVHNFFPLISPSVYYAAKKNDVPVIQTLHNFRLLCCNALLFRTGKICELCIDKSIGWPGIQHGCYRGNRLLSSIVASSFAIHNIAGTWKRMVDCYISLTHFAKEKFVAGGIPEEQIKVKPNFITEDPGQASQIGRFALFIGRLSEEKGIDTLLQAWRGLSDIPLRIAGDGPLKSTVIEATNSNPLITYCGAVSQKTVFKLIKEAIFLILPSEWYEHFPMVIIEAFACGRPVIASRIGSMKEIISIGENGFLFNPGDPKSLAKKSKWLWENKNMSKFLSNNARKSYEYNFTEERNYIKLINIYKSI